MIKEACQLENFPRLDWKVITVQEQEWKESIFHAFRAVLYFIDQPNPDDVQFVQSGIEMNFEFQTWFLDVPLRCEARMQI